MKKMIVCLVLCGFLISGCTGTFQLTNTVYDFHRKQTKWVDEIIFFAFIIIPVYEVSWFVDGLILNSIEFWTGERLIAAAVDATDRQIASSESDVLVKHNKKDNSYVIQTKTATSPIFRIERNGKHIVITDAQHKILYRALKSADGGLLIYDDAGNCIQTVPAESFASLKLNGRGI